jgi:hypothetical protein
MPEDPKNFMRSQKVYFATGIIMSVGKGGGLNNTN